MVMTFLFILNILSSLSQTLWKDMVITFLLIFKIFYCFFSDSMEMCSCSRVPSKAAPSISSSISATNFSNLESKNTCGFSRWLQSSISFFKQRVFERASSSEVRYGYLKVITFKLFGSEWLNIKMWINNCQWVSGVLSSDFSSKTLYISKRTQT